MHAGGWKNGAAVSGDHDNIFTKINDGNIPCSKIYENNHVRGFLEMGPLSEGPRRVIPKERKATLDELSDESAAAIGRVLPRLCRAVMQATGAKTYNVLQNNGSAAHQAVPHVHFHIIPKYSDAGLQMSWAAGALETDGAKRLADQMRASLGADGY